MIAKALLTISLGFSSALAEKPQEEQPECAYYLAQSKLEGAMRGVYAGKDFEAEELLSTGSSINIKSDHIRKTQLFNYVFGSDADDESIIVFGVAMMFNHRNPKTVEHLWADYPPTQSEHFSMVLDEPFTQFSRIDYKAKSAIEAGSELYTSYGEKDDWFSSRGIEVAPMLDINEIPPSELKLHGQCLSHLYVEESTIPMAGKGVFSNISYNEGDTVTISPILILPKHQVRKNDDDNLLINYCLSADGSDVALLPIGHPGMMNHGGHDANVRMEWYTWEGDEQRINSPIKDLEALPYAPLDIRYVATKPIEAGEELLLNYGQEWTKEWLHHLELLEEWADIHGGNMRKSFKPQFRHPIGVPNGFFPDSFSSECIGKGCDESPNLTRRKEFVQDEKKRKAKRQIVASRKFLTRELETNDGQTGEL